MDLMALQFIRPYWFLALLPLFGLMYLLAKNKLGQQSWSDVCDEELLPYLIEQKATPPTRFRSISLFMAALLSIIALAGPTFERLPTPVFRNDAGLVIALDLSSTMDATDIKPSRLARARFKIADLLRQRKDGLSALLVYSADAFTVTPLTNDVATIESQLNALTTNIMPTQGKNTVAGIKQAVALLKQAGQRQGRVLLVTDGVAATTDELVGLLEGYTLSVLGVGTQEGAPIKQAGGGFMKDQNGNIIVPMLQEQTLADLAAKGGGQYMTITADDADIKTLLGVFVVPLNRATVAETAGLIEQWDEKGIWLLLLILPLAALNFRKGLLMFVLIVMLPLPQTSYAFELGNLWLNENQQAQRVFEREEFKQAAKQFKDSRWQAASNYKAGDYKGVLETLKEPTTSDDFYNAANAQVKLGDLAQAKQAYEQALKLNPNNDDAKHNLDLVDEALKKQPPQDQSQQQQNNEDKQQDESHNKEQQGDSSSDNSQQNNNQQDQQDQQDSPSPQDDEASQDDANAEAKEVRQSETADEVKQAEEQLLKRVQSDPAGLLKRKFKYQYRQRRQR